VPAPALVLIVLVSAGCVAYLVHQIRTLARQRRNLRHWEKDEPLEGRPGDWD
jgi:hypothetical protein